MSPHKENIFCKLWMCLWQLFNINIKKEKKSFIILKPIFVFLSAHNMHSERKELFKLQYPEELVLFFSAGKLGNKGIKYDLKVLFLFLMQIQFIIRIFFINFKVVLYFQYFWNVITALFLTKIMIFLKINSSLLVSKFKIMK